MGGSGLLPLFGVAPTFPHTFPEVARFTVIKARRGLDLKAPGLIYKLY